MTPSQDKLDAAVAKAADRSVWWYIKSDNWNDLMAAVARLEGAGIDMGSVYFEREPQTWEVFSDTVHHKEHFNCHLNNQPETQALALCIYAVMEKEDADQSK